MSEKTKNAVVILTHFYNASIRAIFDRVQSEVPAGYDVFLLVNIGKSAESLPEGAGDIRDRIMVCNNASLLEMGYPGKCDPNGWDGQGWTLNPGNTDLLMLLFRRRNPGYDYYWGLEYDVHYQGNWSVFFNHFAPSDADLLATSLYNAAATPHKMLKPFLFDPDGNQTPLTEILRGFYPLHRLSERALQSIHEHYELGWKGHYELGWGTFMSRSGYKVEDFGGDGVYVKPANRNRFYFNALGTWSLSPGTFVFRPPFRKVLPYENTLWHPFKPTEGFGLWEGALKTRFWRRQWIALRAILWPIVIRGWFILFWRGLRPMPDDYSGNP